MAERKKRSRRQRRPRNVVKEVEELEETEEDSQEEEESSTNGRRRRRRRTREPEVVEDSQEEEPEDDEPEDEEIEIAVAEEVTEDEDEEDSQEEEPEPPKKRIATQMPTRKTPKVRVKVAEGIPERKNRAGPEEFDRTKLSALPKSLNLKLDGQKMLDIMEAMRVGETYVIAKVEDNQWRIAISKEALVVHDGPKLKGKEYEEEVFSEEYKQHRLGWNKLSHEEKIERAKELGVTWERHDSPRVDQMRLTTAVRDHLGIEKYKPQYRSRRARAAIRGE